MNFPTIRSPDYYLNGLLCILTIEKSAFSYGLWRTCNWGKFKPQVCKHIFPLQVGSVLARPCVGGSQAVTSLPPVLEFFLGYYKLICGTHKHTFTLRSRIWQDFVKRRNMVKVHGNLPLWKPTIMEVPSLEETSVLKGLDSSNTKL